MSKKSIEFWNQTMFMHKGNPRPGDRPEGQPKPTGMPKTMTFRDKFIRAGSPAFDVDRYIDSELGDNLMKHYENFAPYQDENDPRVYEYWEAHGVRKVLHNGEDSQHKWSSFVPLEAETNPDKRFPVVFVIHGNGSSIFATETYGYCHLAGKEGQRPRL